ncbi:MAG: AMIN domain-containing protein, partial [Rhodocyclaceae bacterium]|nr:AMIN domain-containing protein [Rhodocyclaceae bacterium]
MAEPSGCRRREFLAAGLILLIAPRAFAASGPTLLAVRVWPATDYTRVTLEHDQPLKFSHLLLTHPDRLVLDLEGVEFNSVLQSLPGKILESDPYIKLIRAGRFKPEVVRIVIELKTEEKPQVFTLK